MSKRKALSPHLHLAKPDTAKPKQTVIRLGPVERNLVTLAGEKFRKQLDMLEARHKEYLAELGLSLAPLREAHSIAPEVDIDFNTGEDEGGPFIDLVHAG